VASVRHRLMQESHRGAGQFLSVRVRAGMSLEQSSNQNTQSKSKYEEYIFVYVECHEALLLARRQPGAPLLHSLEDARGIEPVNFECSREDCAIQGPSKFGRSKAGGFARGFEL